MILSKSVFIISSKLVNIFDRYILAVYKKLSEHSWK